MASTLTKFSRYVLGTSNKLQSEKCYSKNNRNALLRPKSNLSSSTINLGALTNRALSQIAFSTKCSVPKPKNKREIYEVKDKQAPAMTETEENRNELYITLMKQHSTIPDKVKKIYLASVGKKQSLAVTESTQKKLLYLLQKQNTTVSTEIKEIYLSAAIRAIQKEMQSFQTSVDIENIQTTIDTSLIPDATSAPTRYNKVVPKCPTDSPGSQDSPGKKSTSQDPCSPKSNPKSNPCDRYKQSPNPCTRK